MLRSVRTRDLNTASDIYDLFSHDTISYIFVPSFPVSGVNTEPLPWRIFKASLLEYETLQYSMIV
jgi:hypothetical protein